VDPQALIVDDTGFSTRPPPPGWSAAVATRWSPTVRAPAQHYGTLARAVLAGRSGDSTSAGLHFATAETTLRGVP
jgi:hypothetical protein